MVGPRLHHRLRKGSGASLVTNHNGRSLIDIARIGDTAAATALAAERAFLAVLDGSCRTPIAGHARLDRTALHLCGLIVKPDGSESFATERRGAARDAAALGEDAGRELRRRAGADFFAV